MPGQSNVSLERCNDRHRHTLWALSGLGGLGALLLAGLLTAFGMSYGARSSVDAVEEDIKEIRTDVRETRNDVKALLRNHHETPIPTSPGGGS